MSLGRSVDGEWVEVAGATSVMVVSTEKKSCRKELLPMKVELGAYQGYLSADPTQSL